MNTDTLNSQQARAWHREPYVWLLILIPVSAVIMGAVMIAVAARSHDGLVVDDYYRHGLEINMLLERDRAAEYYGIKTGFSVDESGRSFTVRLGGNEMFRHPETLHARFIHRTRGGFDQEVFLARADDGAYHAAMPVLVRGKWDVLIEADDWRKFLDYTVR
jgi:hypothetical protein